MSKRAEKQDEIDLPPIQLGGTSSKDKKTPKKNINNVVVLSNFDKLIKKSSALNKYDNWNKEDCPSLESLSINDDVCNISSLETNITHANDDVIVDNTNIFINDNSLFMIIYNERQDFKDENFINSIKEMEYSVSEIYIPKNDSPNVIEVICKMTRLFSLLDWKKENIILFINRVIDSFHYSSDGDGDGIIELLIEAPQIAPLVCQKLHIINEPNQSLNKKLNHFRTKLNTQEMDPSLIELKKYLSRMEIITME